MARPSGRSTIVAALAIVAACAPLPAAAPATEAVAVRAVPVALEPQGREGVAAARTALGDLHLEAALELRADDPRFGGLSGLLVIDDGARLIAVSDRGTIWTADLDHDARDRLTGVGGWRVEALARGPDDPPPARAGDAEALALVGDEVVVAFEQVHRLRRLPLHDLGAVPEPVRAFEGVVRGPANLGIEALADLPDGRLLAIAEGIFEPDGSLSAWIVGDDGARRLGYRAADGFRPTGADRLGDDVFVLERRFSLLGGFQARIVRLPVSEVQPGARLQGEELGRLRPPLPTDNMEGLAARRAADGRVLLYLVSDDNFLPLQRTLLLQFSWRPEAS